MASELAAASNGWREPVLATLDGAQRGWLATLNALGWTEPIDGQPAVEFSVQDTGMGLAPEVMDRLYEAFFSTKPEGMGIGLNLCRTIVESHRGRMQAENIYNGPDVVGCRFSFWLPVLDAIDSVASNEAKVPA